MRVHITAKMKKRELKMIEAYGIILLFSLGILLLFIPLSNAECVAEPSNDLCGLSTLVLYGVFILPLIAIGSIGSVISAIVFKIKKKSLSVLEWSIAGVGVVVIICGIYFLCKFF